MSTLISLRRASTTLAGSYKSVVPAHFLRPTCRFHPLLIPTTRIFTTSISAPGRPPKTRSSKSPRTSKSTTTTTSPSPSTAAKMGKPDSEVVSEFNELVNMSASELEKWLKTEDSTSSGWGQSESGDGPESVGHESGRKIVDILKRNPKKAEDKYTEEDLQHMRKVVSYCKRHLAQEEKMKDTKSKEELEQTKSVRSLKNWGHDPLKY